MASEPFVLNTPIIAGNIAQTIANLTALMAEITSAPKPSYSLHGHSYSWQQLYEWIGNEIERQTKLLSRMQPFEFVSKGF